MNYLYEINHFYTWLTTHPLSPQGQALWHLLMSIDNKSGWPPDFSVPTVTLAAALGVSRTQLSRCRQELKDAGRISHRQRQGSQPPIYRLTPFEPSKAEPADKSQPADQPPKPERKHLPANSPHRLNRVKLYRVK